MNSDYDDSSFSFTVDSLVYWLWHRTSDSDKQYTHTYKHTNTQHTHTYNCLMATFKIKRDYPFNQLIFILHPLQINASQE